MKKILMKLNFLIMTFMCFFLIFLVQNKEYLFMVFEKDTEILQRCIGIMDIIFLILFFIGIFTIRYFTIKTKGNTRIPRRVVSIEQNREVSLAFFAAYILPLVTIEFNDINKLNGFIIIVFLLLALCWKTEFWYTNPILLLIGFKIYEVELESSSEKVIALCRKELKNNDFAEIMEISDEVIFLRKR